MVPEVRAKVRFPLPVLLIGVAILIGVACASPAQAGFLPPRRVPPLWELSKALPSSLPVGCASLRT